MYKARIQRLGKAAVIELPTDPYSLKYELANIGIRTDPKDIPIIDDEDANISVKLFAKTDMENETDFGMRIAGGQGFGNQQMGVM